MDLCQMMHIQISEGMFYNQLFNSLMVRKFTLLYTPFQ